MSATSDPHAPSLTNLLDGRVCPHCVEPVDPISHFCNACGGPTSMHSAIDPMGQVYTAGYAYRQATDRPTKFIIVLGVWLIVAPALLPLAFIGLGLINYVAAPDHHVGSSFMGTVEFTTNNIIGVLLTLGIVLLYVLLVYKTTRAYLRARREARGLCPDCRYDLSGRKGLDTCPKCGCTLHPFEDDEIPVDDKAPTET